MPRHISPDALHLTLLRPDEYRRDIIYPARAKVVLAHIPADADPLSFECIPYLRAVLESSQSSGTRIRVLILCNPHNPLARAYPVETVLAYARLAEEVQDRKSTRLNSSHSGESRMPSSA